MVWWKLFRVKNLLIVALTQFLLQYLVVLPYLKSIDRLPVLDGFHFSLMVFVTVLIAGGGYVINDYYDVKIDSVNRPNQLIISRLVSKVAALKIYWLVVVFGAGISIFLANYVEKTHWFLLYPAAVYLLFEYARSFKKMPGIGNFVVAFFSASVAGIVLFPEVFLNIKLSEFNLRTVYMSAIFSGYIFFAFCSTMYREAVKDLEDMEGDRQFGAQTLPIVWGIRNTKLFAGMWGVLLGIIFAFLIFILFKKGHFLTGGFGLFSVFLPLVFSFFKLKKSNTSSDFRYISQLLKFIMLGGLVFLIFLAKSNLNLNENF